MTLAAPLLNVPSDKGSFDIWAFQLFKNIQEINAALLTQQNVKLPDPNIYPVPVKDIGAWLLQVSSAIGEITSVLRIQTVDVENVDLDNDRERQAWSYSIFTEINQARIQLKI